MSGKRSSLVSAASAPAKARKQKIRLNIKLHLRAADARRCTPMKLVPMRFAFIRVDRRASAAQNLRCTYREGIFGRCDGLSDIFVRVRHGEERRLELRGRQVYPAFQHGAEETPEAR